MNSKYTPLQGLRVLDLSRVLAGPYAASIMADLGATVIKVESCGLGDETRGWGPPFDDNGVSGYYLAANRGKSSQRLNLKDDSDYQKLAKLVETSDVVVHNFLPKTAQTLKVSRAHLEAINSKIIVAAISGFGQDNAQENEPGYDFLVQAMSGLMSLSGPVDGQPTKMGVAITDIVAGLYAVIGILAAVLGQQQDNKSRLLDISLMHCAIASLVNVGQNYLMTEEAPKRFGNEHPNIVPYQVFRCLDGDIAIAIGNDEQFKRFAACLDAGDLAADQKFSTNEKRTKNRQALQSEISTAVAGRSINELCEAFREAKIPSGPIQSLPEVFSSAWAEQRGVVGRNEKNDPILSSPLRIS